MNGHLRSERYFPIQEVATQLGYSAKTVRRWCAEGKLAYIRIGSRMRIPESALARWISEYPTIKS